MRDETPAAVSVRELVLSLNASSVDAALTTAPMDRSRAIAARTAADGGGSRALARNASGDVSGLDAIAAITNDSSGTVCISGRSVSGISFDATSRSYKRTHTPGFTRPARPRRCAADAFEQRPSVNAARCVVGSCVKRFTRPLSTT